MKMEVYLQMKKRKRKNLFLFKRRKGLNKECYHIPLNWLPARSSVFKLVREDHEDGSVPTNEKEEKKEFVFI